jgi:hypothetical protein
MSCVATVLGIGSPFADYPVVESFQRRRSPCIASPSAPRRMGPSDYAFATLNTVAPTLFGLTGPAKAICYSFAASQGLLNALTDHPLAVKKVVPLRMHGKLETPYVPAILLLPLLTGAFKQCNARLYFGTFLAMAVTNYILTDYNAYEPEKSLPGGQQAMEDIVGTVEALPPA